MTQFETEIDAVHSRDLEKLFGRMGIWNDFKAGKLVCKFCHEGVTENNIYSVLPESGNFSLICDKPICVMALSEYLAGKAKTTPVI